MISFNKPGTLWTGALAVGFVVIVARVALDGRAALRAGEAAETRGDRAGAIRHYGEAVRHYLPASPSVRHALKRLEATAQAAEAAHDKETARRALEAARAALLGSRSFYTPYAERLPAIEGHLARLYADAEDPRLDPGASREARAAWHMARFARTTAPALPHVLLAFLGLALWLAAAAAFFRRGLDSGHRLRRGPAVAAGVVFVIGFALFLTGLRLA